MTNVITEPTLRDLEVGSTAFFEAQKRMIREKPLIRRCYDLWYRRLLADADSVPHSESLPIVELGSGSSYIKEIRPSVITSDITPGVADMVIDGRTLPFRDGSVAALLLTHVFHHIPDVCSFFSEASRVLAPGGVISMVDCTHTPFARFFFGKIHPEPYDDRTTKWTFPSQGKMLDSNQALTWIVFERDARRFMDLYPEFAVEGKTYLPWLTYLLSGGVNLKSLVPPFLAPTAVYLDAAVGILDPVFAVHWHITIRKQGR